MPTSRAFFCRSCHEPIEQHVVSGAQQRLRANGKMRLYAHIRCLQPAREWWSAQKVVLARAREADAVARGS